MASHRYQKHINDQIEICNRNQIIQITPINIKVQQVNCL